MSPHGGDDDRVEPPGLARRVLAWLCPPVDRRFVMSDLAEEFEARAAADGGRQARRWYRGQVLRSALPCARRRLGALFRSSGRGGLGDLGGDVRYALGRLVTTPVQTLVTVVSLGVGIGLTTSVFAVANAFLFQAPGGLTNTDGLVALFTSDERGGPYNASSYPDVQEMANLTGVFQDVAAIRAGAVRWEGGGASRRVLVEIVDGGFFDVLGVTLPLGRSFAPEETVLGQAAPVAIVSYEVWQELFDGDRSILGRVVRLDGREFTVIGVAPEGLLGRFMRLRIDVWVPVGLPGGIYHSTPRELRDRAAREYLAWGRLAPGVPPRQAQARLDALAARLRQEHPEAWLDDRGSPRRLTLLTEEEARVPPDARAAMGATAGFLLAGAALVLLIACLNVAGLFLARALARRREIAVRLSLGAGRGRIVRLLLAEALAPALAGGVVGLGITFVAARALGSIPVPLDVPLGFDVGIDGRVLGFALATSVATCLAFGLLPALRASRPDLVGALRGDESGGRGGRLGVRQTLVTLQVAGSLALLLGAALCLRSTGALASADPGLDPEDVAVASWQPEEGQDDEESARSAVLELSDRLLASPEIEEVAAAAVAELSPWAREATAELRVDGRDPTASGRTVVAGNVVSPGYFAMLDLKPVRGRTFGAADDATSAPVAVVNETFARTFWPGGEALGRRFTILRRRFVGRPYDYLPRAVEVIGVLPDVRVLPGRDEPFFWTSLLQDHSPGAVFHVRSPNGPAAAVPELRRIVQERGGVYLVPAQSYARLVELNTLGPRLALEAFTWSGGFALLLALMGIYGVVSFSVGQRTREMAVRQAIGAGAVRVVRAVVLDAMKLAALGAVVGLAVALPLAALARSSLYGISPLDPAALAGAVAVLLAAALAATVVPARRAAHVDPMRILREE